VAKGEPRALPGVTVHPSSAFRELALPPSDVLLIPADLEGAETLFGLAPEFGAPIILLQGYGFPDAPLVEANLVGAPHVICTASWLVARAQRAGASTSLVRYGLDRSIFSPGPDAATRGPVASLMTHTLNWKGTADGLAALALAQTRLPDLQVRLFGKADPAGFTPAPANASYLPSPNRLSQVAAVMRESAVFVCASWEEGFGIPGIEAITSGAALATTDTKGSRDYAVHERTALVSTPRDPEALADSVVRLISDPSLRRRLTEAGNRHVRTLCPSWAQATETLVTEAHLAAGQVRQQRRRRRWIAEAGAERRELETEIAGHVQDLAAARQETRRLSAELNETRTARQAAEAAQRDTESARAELQRRLSQLEHELTEAAEQRRTLTRRLTAARADAQVAQAQLSELEGRMGLNRPGPGSGASDPDAGRASLDALEALPSARQPARQPRPTRVNRAAVAAAPPAAAGHPPASASGFADRYDRLLAHPVTDSIDALSRPMPRDRHGVLVRAGEPQEPGEPTVDVVIPVHNALEDTRLCLWALLHRGTRRFRLIVVDDGSDAATAAFLSACAHQLPAMTLIGRSDPPHGYSLAANAGLRASTSDYVVVLNSDTRVTRGWLEQIIHHGELHPELGILGPLSNAASHQSVPQRRDGGSWATNPLPDWLTEDGMALLVATAPRCDPRLPFINGFCYVIRRAVMDAIGLLDEARFPAGFGEENDYSLRAAEAGFGLGVVAGAYVFHAKSRSYGTDARRKLAAGAYRVLHEKHGESRFEAIVAELEADTTLDPTREAIAAATASPTSTEAAIRTATRGPALSVAFVLPGLSRGGSGGSHSIHQEALGLRRLGVDTRILIAAEVAQRARDTYADTGGLFQAFTDVDDLTARCADVDVLISTHFKSVPMVAAVCRAHPQVLPAYYIQDYEPLFEFGDSADNAEAAASYTLIPGALLFAKTHWLANVVSERHGVFVAKVEPSLDSDVYRSEPPAARTGSMRVAAMIRPRTPRRQPRATLEVLERLRRERPGGAAIRTFGCSDAELAELGASTETLAGHAGILTRAEVAQLLGESDVFLDMSTYQAFGRTALEAMACGATAIVPWRGGVSEFVEADVNALAVDTLDPESAYLAATGLIDDPDRLLALRTAAHLTAARHSVARACISEYALLTAAHRRHAEARSAP
jgi:GT2 family glycosyltransferase/glycosyltransferase involved in cell wall biosynthesis